MIVVLDAPCFLFLVNPCCYCHSHVFAPLTQTQAEPATVSGPPLFCVPSVPPAWTAGGMAPSDVAYQHVANHRMICKTIRKTNIGMVFAATKQRQQNESEMKVGTADEFWPVLVALDRARRRRKASSWRIHRNMLTNKGSHRICSRFKHALAVYCNTLCDQSLVAAFLMATVL